MRQNRFESFTDTELITLRYWFFSFHGVNTTKLLLNTSDDLFEELMVEIKKRKVI